MGWVFGSEKGLEWDRFFYAKHHLKQRYKGAGLAHQSSEQKALVQFHVGLNKDTWDEVGNGPGDSSFQEANCPLYLPMSIDFLFV